MTSKKEYVSDVVKAKHASRDRYLDANFSECPKCRKNGLVEIKKGIFVYDFCDNCGHRGKKKEEKS